MFDNEEEAPVTVLETVVRTPARYPETERVPSSANDRPWSD